MKRAKKSVKRPKRPSAKRKSVKQAKKTVKKAVRRKAPAKKTTTKKTPARKAAAKKTPRGKVAPKRPVARGAVTATKVRAKTAQPAAAAADAAAKVAPLNLASWAQEAALILAGEFPDIDFTSGRRDMARQARAMAGNIVTRRNYIRNTYADTEQSRSLQKWVDDHPEATTADAITEGLKSVMKDWTDDQLAKISRHIAGLAFDVPPISGDGADAVKDRMKTLPHLQKPPIFVEDGLDRWHAQFKSKAEDPGDS